MSSLNDPRVFFAVERTALAWNRTALTLMAFGFAIERFGLFMRMIVEKETSVSHSGVSFWVGQGFILLGGAFCVMAARQYRTVLKTMNPAEIPEGYNTHPAFVINAIVALLALGLSSYLFYNL